MGTNSSKFDLTGHYAKKSMKELQDLLKQYKDGLSDWNSARGIGAVHEFYNSHIAKLQLLIAERIGK